MAKLKQDPISAGDIGRFFSTETDFVFELSVLRLLRSKGFQCFHGATYHDPATDKSREFDIRALFSFQNRFVRLAVECKNLSRHIPLVVACVPRLANESWFCVMQAKRILGLGSGVLSTAPIASPSTAVAVSASALYPTGGSTGKQTYQIGLLDNGEFQKTDTAAFDKWAQAIASAHELVTSSAYLRVEGFEECWAVTFPILVVPDGTLWTVDYDFDGNRMSEPCQVDRCSRFIATRYDDGAGTHQVSYHISHLEFMTLTGLVQFADLLLNDIELEEPSGGLLFPFPEIRQTLRIIKRELS
jgi:hypothetical protein